jgi:hypothetical protein
VWSSLLNNLSPEILLWHAGSVDADPLYGLPIMDDTDVEALGIDPNFATELAEEHYEFVQNWTNQKWVTADTMQYGSGYSPSYTSGPQTTEILKQVSTLDKLTDLSPTGWHSFYKLLRRHVSWWRISLVPFEAISLNYECMGHNLCLCGLGLTRWKTMGDALFLVLEYLLPTTNTTIANTLDTLANTRAAANGYELLWTLLKEFIPMLNCTKPTPFPSWPESADIFQYARLVLMYCDLARHHGPPYTEAMKSRMFLMNVRGSYVSITTQFTALVATYCPGRDGVTRCKEPLPRHLMVLELARTLFDEVALRSTMSSSGPPLLVQAYHLSASVTEDHPPTLASLDTPVSLVTHSTTTSVGTSSHLQGFAVNLTRRPPQSSRRSPPNPSGRATAAPTRSPPRYDGTCAACGKYGHEAVCCDMLGMALFLKRYSADRNNSASIQAAEARWMERNKKFLPCNDHTPQTILANYCAEMRFTDDVVDNELDWEYLAMSSEDPSSPSE